jgi:hypothetical protein
MPQSLWLRRRCGNNQRRKQDAEFLFQAGGRVGVPESRCRLAKYLRLLGGCGALRGAGEMGGKPATVSHKR